MSFGHLRETGGLQLLLAFDLDQAEAARAHVGEPAEMAQPGNVDAAVPGGGEDGLAFEWR